MPGTRTAGRRAVGLAACAVALLSALVSAHESPGEYHVKAAFLYNFVKFVEWPAASFRDAGAPFVLCVLGHDPFEGALEETVRNRPVAGRNCVIRRLTRRDEPSGCHVLFAGLFDDAGIAEDLERVARLPTLTVGETDRFEQAGGIIRFVVEENRVRFVINAGAAHRAGLIVSSRLLGIARSVTGQGGSRSAPKVPDGGPPS